MTTINGVINKVSPKKSPLVLNGGNTRTANGLHFADYNKWRMNWNGNLFAPPETGSVLYLPGYPGFGSTTFDFSGQGNNGVITGAIWKQMPTGLWYLDFDGINNNVNIGVDIFVDADFSGGASMMVWANINTVDAADQMLLQVEERLNLEVQQTSDKFTFHNFDGVAEQAAVGNAAINTGQWYFVVGSWDGTTVRLYQDSVLQTTTDTTSTPPALDAVSRASGLGYGITSAVQPADAKIALARIFDRGLTAAEILSIYNQERHLFGV